MNWKSLISDDNENLSIGRTTMWLFTLVILYKFAVDNQDIPSNIVYIYGMLVFYNLSKKPMPVLEKMIESKFGAGNVKRN